MGKSLNSSTLTIYPRVVVRTDGENDPSYLYYMNVSAKVDDSTSTTRSQKGTSGNINDIAVQFAKFLKECLE